MRRKFLTLTVIIGSLALGACTEDSTLDEISLELNDMSDTGGGVDGDKDKPGESFTGGGEGDKDKPGG